MKFNLDEITSVIQQEISQYENQLDVTQVGKVIEVGDSFVTIEIAEGVRVKVQKFQVGSLMPKGTLKSA